MTKFPQRYRDNAETNYWQIMCPNRSKLDKEKMISQNDVTKVAELSQSISVKVLQWAAQTANYHKLLFGNKRNMAKCKTYHWQEAKRFMRHKTQQKFCLASSVPSEGNRSAVGFFRHHLSESLLGLPDNSCWVQGPDSRNKGHTMRH